MEKKTSIYSQRIKDFRSKRKITQEKLAEMLRVNQRTVQRWESGERTPRTTVIAFLEKLSKGRF